MITLYGFGRIFRAGIGETKDLRVEWALQETGLPYRVHGLDHTAGELDSPAFSKISPFHQAPVIDDDGFIVAESGAAVLYIAEKAGKLIPSDFEGRMRVTQWCFAALSTVAPTLSLLGLGDIAGLKDEGRALGSRSPSGGWMGWSDVWMAARGSPARNSQSPTSFWPRSCGKCARPISWPRIRG